MFFSPQTKTNQLIAELVPKHDDKEYQDTSQIAKDIVQELGNLEAHEILLITDTV